MSGHDPLMIPSVEAMWQEARARRLASLGQLDSPEVEAFLSALLKEMFYTSFGFALQAFGFTQGMPQEGARRAIELLMQQQMEGIKQLKLCPPPLK